MTAPIVRRLLPQVLTVAEAKAITGGLSGTTAMMVASYDLDAKRCGVGSKLRDDPNSTCFDCYACSNFFQMGQVQHAQDRRHAALDHHRWTDAMVVLIKRYAKKHFRWHCSGDVMSLDHLRKIIEVCRRTLPTKHWLPTKQFDFVAELVRAEGKEVIPSNLTVRLSAYYLNTTAIVPPELEHLPTATVHTDAANPVPGSYVCPKVDEDGRGECGPCRACWNPRAKNVTYLKHGKK